MTTYNRKTSSQPLKWLVALIVFMLALGFTTSEVVGLTVPSQAGWDNSGRPAVEKTSVTDKSRTVGGADEYHEPVDPDYSQDDDGDGDNPDPVPEPGTILLLTMGLGGAWLAARKMS